MLVLNVALWVFAILTAGCTYASMRRADGTTLSYVNVGFEKKLARFGAGADGSVSIEGVDNRAEAVKAIALEAIQKIP